MKINKDLLWDHDVREDAEHSEYFRVWYLERVLEWGTRQDIHDVGLNIIREYLPRLRLPPRIKTFWEWYFSEGQNHVRAH